MAILRKNLKTLIIANPISGRGKAQRHLPGVKDVFRRAGWDVDTLITKRSGDARRAAESSGAELLISFGGDGTFNEILNGADIGSTMLSVIPAGTGNVLAHELRMPFNPVRAAMAITDGRIFRYDTAVANGRRFAFACGVGLDAHIVRLLHRRRSGNITQFHYLPYLLKSALNPPCWDIRVSVDGEFFSEKVNAVCIGNAKSYGGPIEITPQADPSDGLLDVTAMRLESPLDIPVLALAALTRGLANCSYTRTARGRRIFLHACQNHAPYHIDGDFAGMLPLTITIDREPMCLIGPVWDDGRDRILPV